MKTWIIAIIVGMAISAGPLLDGTGGVNQQKKEWTK